MSAFDSVALPGRMPTHSSGVNNITPESLFRDKAEKAIRDSFIAATGQNNPFEKPLAVKKVKVEIFDLSDDAQKKKYEKLWAELLMKVSRMEACVESSKDLVKRPDGTSYWMKYVEYVEFGEKDVKKDKGGEI